VNYDPNTPPSGEGRQGQSWTERIDVTVDQLAARIQEMVSQGNVRSLKIRHEGRTILDIPLTAAVVGGAAGIMLAPFLTAVVAIAGIVARVELIVEREGEPPSLPPDRMDTPKTPGEGI
jgi:hypothetical protein